MTDVTGFGLLGHLGEMLVASNAGATVRLDGVPLLDGALGVAQRGIRSSLHAANRVWRGDVEAGAAVSGSARFELLFDPQTAGGLLAGVPLDRAEAAVAALRAASEQDETILTGAPVFRSSAQMDILNTLDTSAPQRAAPKAPEPDGGNPPPDEPPDGLGDPIRVPLPSEDTNPFEAYA